jgi:nucleoside-diphosphate-sugar epimerase
MNKKILITGAGGFIGGHLVKNLKKNNEIICADIKPFDIPPPEIVFSNVNLPEC